MLVYNDNLNDLFATLITIVVTLNSITIPVSYSIVSEKYKEYLDPNISRRFINSHHFLNNFIISIICIGCYLVPLLFNQNLKDVQGVYTLDPPSYCFRNGYLYACLVLFIFFMVCFIDFSLFVYKYATETDEIVFDYVKGKIDSHRAKKRH